MGQTDKMMWLAPVSLLVTWYHAVLCGADGGTFREAPYTSGYLTNSSSPEYFTNSIEVRVIQRSTTSLKLSWESPDRDLQTNVTAWFVRCRVGETVFGSGNLTAATEYFIVEGLQADTTYAVCVTVHLGEEYSTSATRQAANQPIQSSVTVTSACTDVTTLSYIRSGSLLAVILTVCTILVLIMIGVIKWMVVRNQHSKSRTEKAYGVVEMQDQSEVLTPAFRPEKT